MSVVYCGVHMVKRELIFPTKQTKIKKYSKLPTAQQEFFIMNYYNQSENRLYK